MKKNILTFSLVLAYLTACTPSSGPNKTSEQKQTSDAETSYSFLNQALPLKTKIFLASLSEKMNWPKPEDSQNSLLEAKNAYIKVQEDIASEVNILNFSKTGIDYILTATAAGATSFGVSVPAAIAIEITNKAINDSLEIAIGKMETKGQEEAAKILAEKLRQISANEIKEFNELKKLKPEVALSKAEKMVDSWMTEKDFYSIPTTERAEARAIIASWTARTAIAKLAQHQSAQEIINTNTAANLDETKKQVIAIGKSLKIFAKETKATLDSMVASQEKISDQVSVISKKVQEQIAKVDKIADDVDFLKTFAFARMRAREQLSYLKKVGPGTEDKEKWQLKMATLENKVTFEESYQKYFSGVQNLLTIAKNLGVEGQTLQDVAEGVAKIDKIKSGIEDIASQNYLTGIATLAGLFGGGSNAESVHHQAIIARLDKVLDNQKMLSEQIQISFQIQVDMLTQLSNQIRQSTEALYIKMDKVHNDVLGNRYILSHLSLKGLNYCSFASSEIAERGLKEAFLNRANFKTYISSCALEYDNIFKSKDYAAYFSTGVYKEVLTKELFEAQESVYNDSLEYLAEHLRQFSPSLSLINPSENAFGLIKKTQVLSQQSEIKGLGESFRESLRELDKLKIQYYSPVVLKHLQRLIALMPAINLWNARSTDNFAKPSDLVNLQKDSGNADLALIDSALELVNLNIQQESLIAGDIILPTLFEDFAAVQNEKDLCLSNFKVTGRCLLKNNQLLFKNFLVYGLYRDFYDQGFALSAYKTQLRIKDDVQGMKNLFKKDWRIEWNKEQSRYDMTLAGVKVPMPSFEDVAEAKFSYSESMPSLLKLREDLIHTKAEMLMATKLKTADQMTIYKLFLK